MIKFEYENLCIRPDGRSFHAREGQAYIAGQTLEEVKEKVCVLLEHMYNQTTLPEAASG